MGSKRRSAGQSSDLLVWHSLLSTPLIGERHFLLIHTFIYVGVDNLQHITSASSVPRPLSLPRPSAKVWERDKPF